MFFGRIAAIALGAIAVCGVGAATIERRAQSSTAQPVEVPYNEDMISQAAGLVQQSYCKPGSYKPGLQIGDSKLLWTTGDGNHRQRVLIYHSKSLGIAVAFEGTNSSSLLSDLNDVLARPDPPNNLYREYMPNGVKLMHGFQDAYVKLAADVMPAIKKYKDQFHESRVTVIGHSLGAAIGLIASMDVQYRIDCGLYKSYLFGLPRVGNAAFADVVDKTIGHKLHWFVSGRDWVPSMPPREFGYQHPSNYVWIYPANTTNWKLYPGQENVHGFPTVSQEWGSFDDHQGVYFHTQIGASLGRCPATVGKD